MYFIAAVSVVVPGSSCYALDNTSRLVDFVSFILISSQNQLIHVRMFKATSSGIFLWIVFSELLLRLTGLAILLNLMER